MRSRTLLWRRVALAGWWAGMTIGSHWPRLDLAGLVGRRNDDFAFGLDKWVHIGAYAGLTVLALLAVGHGIRRLGGRTSVGLVMAALLLWAAIDELTQAFVPGRELWWSDFCASSIGIGLGAIGWGLAVGLSAHDGSFVAHTRIISALTLVSRMFGLVRDAVLSRVFGISTVFDAFTLAFMVPNLFRRLFGEGALSAAFIPLYARLEREHPQVAQRFAAVVIGLLLIALSTLALITAAGVDIAAAGLTLDERGELVLRLIRITILYMPLICTAAVLGGLLQVHGRFGIVAASPILLNIFLIAAAAGGYHALYGPHELDRVAVLVAIAVVLSGIVQVLWTLWGMSRSGLGVRRMLGMMQGISTAWRAPELRRPLGDLWRTAWPTALGLAVFQINALADVLIAWFFSATEASGSAMMIFGQQVAYPMREGAVATLGRAQLLYEFPHGVFGIAVATAIFPALAKAAQDAARPGAFADLLRQGLRLAVFIGLPAGVGLMLVREPLCRAIFFPGDQLSKEASSRIAFVLLGYAPAIWAYATNMILTRAFYAQGDTRTPMRLSIMIVGLNIMLNLLLIWPLAEAGLAWSTAICAIVQTGILLLWVRRYVERPVDGHVAVSWLKTAALSAVMALVVWVVLQPFDVFRMDRLRVIAVLGAACAVGAVTVFLGAWLLRMPELRWLSRGR
jgi:putative peptidoglycan lipid II flippase